MGGTFWPKNTERERERELVGDGKNHVSRAFPKHMDEAIGPINGEWGPTGHIGEGEGKSSLLIGHRGKQPMGGETVSSTADKAGGTRGALAGT